MNKCDPLLERLSHVLADSTVGVLGLVDELLAIARDGIIQLNWQAGCCRVSRPNADPLAQIEVPMSKPVMRAALARIATLCNTRMPESVSPYGGVGEITTQDNPKEVICVSFVNKPDVQKLELTPSTLVIRNGDLLAVRDT